MTLTIKEGIRMSEIIIDLRLRFKIPDSPLTINSLIYGLKESCQAINGNIIVTIMRAIEEQLIETMVQNSPGRYKRNGYQRRERTLKSSLGTIKFRFAQLIDTGGNQKHTIAPLVKFLGIPSYARYLEESIEPAIGLSVHTSYRRSTSEVKRLQGITMSHTTVHRRLQQVATNNCPFTNMKKTAFRFLLVDGTKIHLQGPSGEDLGKVEMRWALASLGPRSRFEPVGFWINTSWSQICQELKHRLDYQKIKVLLSDGGPGIEENLLQKGMRYQRCQLHGKRDFPYLLYADGAKKTEQTPFIEKLKSIPAMKLTKSQLETIRPEDRHIIEEIAENTTKGFQELLNTLDPNKYPKARTYIKNLIDPVTTFLGWWLNKGEFIPLTTNAIETAFSQVCNRIKKVGRRWSEQGLLNWLKITFYKIFKPETWNLVWLENNQPIPLIKLISIQTSYSWSESIT
jgi:hypothetical protein